MGLIDQAQERKTPFESRSTQTPDDGTSKIMQSTVLLDVANQVLSLNSLPPKSKKRCANFRKKIGDTSWLLSGLMGNVDQAIWSNMVGKAIEGQEKTILHSQPNGTWKISDYEVDIRRDKANDERLFLATQWVDLDNKPELQYQNGAPAVNVNISSPEVPKELLKALSSKGGNDEELKGLLKQLIGAMASNAVTTTAPQLPPEADSLMEGAQSTDPDSTPADFDDNIQE
jgi:hypothetical protein